MNTQDEDNTENKVHMLKFLGNKMGFMMQEELTGAAHYQLQSSNFIYLCFIHTMDMYNLSDFINVCFH